MVDFKDYTYKMDRTLEVLQEDFGAVRAGRANARVLDRISVEYYGVDTPIGQVGTIASPDARPLVIQLRRQRAKQQNAMHRGILVQHD